jgi:ferredoxin-NADP reductase
LPSNPEPEFNVRVVKRDLASSTVLALEVAALDDASLPSWDPGAHVDVLLPNGLVRQYSLCGRRDDVRRWRFGVLREENGRGGSAYIHDHLKERDVMRLRGPRNNFQLVKAPSYLFIAGGVGITPLLPMLHAATAERVQWTLFYSGRSRAAMAFTDEIAQFGSQAVLWPQDRCGLLDLDRILSAPNTDSHVYCCGPEPLIAAVEGRFRANGRLDNLHVERFKAAEDPSRENRVLSVVLRRSNKTVQVGANESILEAVERAGLRPPFSCREGTCGTCETSVLKGGVDHRDAVLSEAERQSGKTMMICVSRCKDAVLELDL